MTLLSLLIPAMISIFALDLRPLPLLLPPLCRHVAVLVSLPPSEAVTHCDNVTVTATRVSARLREPGARAFVHTAAFIVRGGVCFL